MQRVWIFFDLALKKNQALSVFWCVVIRSELRRCVKHGSTKNKKSSHPCLHGVARIAPLEPWELQSSIYSIWLISPKKPIIISFIIHIIGSIIYLNIHIESKITNPKNIFLISWLRKYKLFFRLSWFLILFLLSSKSIRFFLRKLLFFSIYSWDLFLFSTALNL